MSQPSRGRRAGLGAAAAGCHVGDHRPRTLDHLHGNLAAFDLDLPADVATRLEEISRRPNLAPINGMDASR
jgi:hypothetical protein